MRCVRTRRDETRGELRSELPASLSLADRFNASQSRANGVLSGPFTTSKSLAAHLLTTRHQQIDGFSSLDHAPIERFLTSKPTASHPLLHHISALRTRTHIAPVSADQGPVHSFALGNIQHFLRAHAHHAAESMPIPQNLRTLCTIKAAFFAWFRHVRFSCNCAIC
eukprot:230423-Rhodomonas_salina.4